MSIKTRLNIIVFLSIITITGLYLYIVKITMDIDEELRQIEKIEMFDQFASQLVLTSEDYLATHEERYAKAWNHLIGQLDSLSTQIEDFRRYHIVSESIPSLSNAFNLIVEINRNPDLYPVTELNDELLQRATVRIRSDVRQLLSISHRILNERLEYIRVLQVEQRRDFLFVLVPAIIMILIMAYRMRRNILNSLAKLESGTQAFSEGKLEERMNLTGDDELAMLARQFNSMAGKLQEKAVKEKALSDQIKLHAVELKEINNELEQFAYMASHDLKEPLRMIRNFLQLLEKKYNDQLDKKAQQYIYFAVDGAERMTNLINDLLEYSRAGRMNDKFEDIDATQLVSEVASLYENETHSNSVGIKFGRLPVIRAVPLSLKMVFKNLVSNAVKYRKTGDKVTVEIGYSESDTHWHFFVSDNGIGIEKLYHEEIFTIFKRLHAPDQYKSTGIGLAICRKIVEQHGGKIWVESEPGTGSTFFFTIKKRQESL